jgi:ABC-type phosphate transport system substrate-binding protein
MSNAMAQDMVVVVDARDTTLALDRNQIRNIYLGRINRLPNGSPVVPLDQRESNALRDIFYTRITSLSAAQAKAQWAKLYFTGRGIPPREYASNDEIKRAVTSTPGAIAYIEKSALDASVRVILVENYQ